MGPFRQKKAPRAGSDITVEDAIRHAYQLLDEADQEHWETTPIGMVLRWHLTLGEQAQLAAAGEQYPPAIQQVAISALATEAFRKGGWIRLPGHVGFRLVAASLARAGAAQRAMAVCEEAARQGWAGDWQARIERYQIRMRSAPDTRAHAM